MQGTLNFKPRLQNYDWGATEGLLPSLYSQRIGQRVAEAWFGPYENCELVERLKEVYHLTDLQIASLPLAKILQAGTERPLSIQVHPQESLAVELHRENPSYYPDARGKYEVSIALQNYSLLYNVADFSTLGPLFEEGNRLHPLFHLLSDELKEKYQTLRNIPSTAVDGNNWSIDAYCYLLTETNIKARASAIDSILTAKPTALDEPDRNFERLVEVSRRFKNLFSSNDPGVVAPLLMNIVDLKPGETIDIVPGIPHAYLPDACMFEIMVPSDNVCRVGATTKPTDPDGLRRCLKGLVAGLGNLVIGIPDTGGISTIDNPHFSVLSYSKNDPGSISLQTSRLPLLIIVVRGSVIVGSEVMFAGQGGYLKPNILWRIEHSGPALFCMVDAK